MGQRTKTIKEKIDRHIAQIIRGDRRLNMVNHFSGHDCSLSNLMFAPIQQVTGNISNRSRNQAERIGDPVDPNTLLAPAMGNELHRETQTLELETIT